MPPILSQKWKRKSSEFKKLHIIQEDVPKYRWSELWWRILALFHAEKYWQSKSSFTCLRILILKFIEISLISIEVSSMKLQWSTIEVSCLSKLRWNFTWNFIETLAKFRISFNWSFIESFNWNFLTIGGAGVNEYNTISVEGCGHFPNAGTGK